MSPPLVPPGFPTRTLLALLFVALLLRLGTNASRIDEYFEEGLSRGAITQAWISDLPVWPSHAPQIPHMRGSVVMSWLSVPAFHLLGPTTFAVRLSGIVFHLLGLATLMLLLHRQFGRRTAMIGGALFTLASPGMAKLAVLSYGDHVESLPFAFAALLFALTWLDDDSGRRYGTAFLAGLLAGLAVSWHAQARIPLVSLALIALLCAPRRLLARDTWLGALPGLLAGLSVLWIGNWLTSTNGLHVFGKSALETLADGAHSGSLGKWVDFWVSGLARSQQYPWALAGAATITLAAICAIGLAARSARILRRTDSPPWRRQLLRVGVFALHPLVFSLAYAATRFTLRTDMHNAISARYVLPVLPWVLLPIAVAGARASEAGRRGLAALIVVPALLLGASGSLSTWDLDTIRHEPPRRAGLWSGFGAHFLYGSLTPDDRLELRELERSLYGDPDQDKRVKAWLEQHADADRVLATLRAVDAGPEWSVLHRHWVPLPAPRAEDADTPSEAAARVRDVPGHLRVFAAADAGDALARQTALSLPVVAALQAEWTAPDEQRAFARGLGTGLARMLPPRKTRGDLIAERVEALSAFVDAEQIGFGCGARVGRNVHEFLSQGWIPVREVLAHAQEPMRTGFARGLGAGYSLRFLHPPASTLDSPAVRNVLSHLPDDLHATFRQGLGETARDN